MVRDIILMIYMIGLLLTIKVTDIQVEGILIMICSIIVAILLLVIPEIFFKNGDLAKTLTKRII
jgi:hypothetical protein